MNVVNEIRNNEQNKNLNERSEWTIINLQLLILEKPVESAPSTLQTINGVTNVEVIGGSNGHATYRIVGEKMADLCPAIYQVASTNQWPVRELRSDHQTLESVFSQLATKG